MAARRRPRASSRGTCGFDPLHDLDEILIASSGEGQKAPTLIVARGKFDVARLAPNGELYKGVTLVTPDTKAQNVFGFLDVTTAVAGDPVMVKAAIDRHASPAPLPAALAAQVADYNQHYDIWGVVNRAAGLAGYVPSSSKASPLDSIDHFQFGLALKQGLELAAEVHARTAKDADQMAATMQLFSSMANASQPAGSNGTKFDVKNTDGTLKISLAVSEQDLKKAIEAQRKGGLMRTNGLAPRPATPVQTPLSEPSQPKVSKGASAPALAVTDGGTAVFTLPAPQ